MPKSENNKEAAEPAGIVKCTYTAATPCYFDHEEQEYHLHYNNTYDLPWCPMVQTLIGQGILKQIP